MYVHMPYQVGSQHHSIYFVFVAGLVARGCGEAASWLTTEALPCGCYLSKAVPVLL